MARKNVNTTRRSNWLLVVAGCLALTAIAISYWQNTSGATPSSPAPMQLKIATAPAATDVAPAAPSKDVAAAAPVKDTASAPTTSAPVAKAPTTKAPAAKTEPRLTRRDPPGRGRDHRQNAARAQCRHQRRRPTSRRRPRKRTRRRRASACRTRIMTRPANTSKSRSITAGRRPSSHPRPQPRQLRVGRSEGHVCWRV